VGMSTQDFDKGGAVVEARVSSDNYS